MARADGQDEHRSGRHTFDALVSRVILQPNSPDALDALLILRSGVIGLAAVLLAIVGLLWTGISSTYWWISVGLCGFLIGVTLVLALFRRVCPARLLEWAILAGFLSDVTVELVLIGPADSTRSAFLLFPLATVVSAAMIGGTRSAVICLLYLAVGYPIAVYVGVLGLLDPLAPPYETIENVPQVLYHTVSQMGLISLLLVMFIYVIGRLRARTRSFDDQLRQARMQIELDTRRRVNEEHLVQMGRMTSFLAHELRNPLTGILTSAELAEMDKHDPALVEENTRDIKHETLRMSRMLNDVLDYTREFQSQPRNHDIFPCLEDLVDGALRDADVEWDGPLTLPVFADPDHVQQVLHNLIHNAVQAAGSQGRVVIRTALPDEDRVLVEVHDDGPGIPVEDRARVFEAFFTTKPKGEGFGLGLAICRRLSQLNAMQLEVGTSDLGGALLRLTLPAALADAPLDAPSGASLDEIGDLGEEVNRYNVVLVVEDEDRLRHNVQRTISREGLTVHAAANLAQARAHIAEHQPRVILLDLALGDEDGADLFDDLPEGDRRPAVLVTSAYSDPERRARLRRLGAADYLVKPIQRKVLLDAIQDQLARTATGEFPARD